MRPNVSGSVNSAIDPTGTATVEGIGGGIFVHKYLKFAVEYYLNFLLKRRQQSRAFLMLGLLAAVTKQHIRPFVDDIFKVVRLSLPTKEAIKLV